jgi:hypothetical protein
MDKLIIKINSRINELETFLFVFVPPKELELSTKSQIKFLKIILKELKGGQNG